MYAAVPLHTRVDRPLNRLEALPKRHSRSRHGAPCALSDPGLASARAARGNLVAAVALVEPERQRLAQFELVLRLRLLCA